MYIGNLSNFFYKDKNWLYKQPKFSMDSNKNHNIIKIGKNYYTSDNLTGKLKLIKSNDISKINNEEKNEKENKDFFPETLINNQKKKNNSSYTYNNTERNYENNSNNKILSLYSKIIDNKNKSKNYINTTYNYSTTNKTEDNLLNNSNINKEENILSDEKEKKLFKVKTNEIIFKNNIIKSRFKSRIKCKKNNTQEKGKKDYNRLLSKRNLKKIIEKRQKSIEELKTTITTNNNSNNNININIGKPTNNHKNNKNKVTINDMKQFNFSKAFFPNDKSLRIQNDDSWYLKTIKNQLFKDRITNHLKKQYQFYEDSTNKREDLGIPKMNYKKTILLNKNVIFPAKELIYHKIYFEYVNKQKKNDKKNSNNGFKFPLVENKK